MGYPTTLTLNGAISMSIYRKNVNHRKIYEDHYGLIPKDEQGRSYEIHHIDGNHENNAIDNLICVSIQEHYNIHYLQGDYKACLIMSKRMKISSEEKSRLAKISNTGENNPSYGIYWWTNGIEEKKSKIQPSPEWIRGRSSKLKTLISATIVNQDIRAGTKNTSHGKYWWTNGIDSIKSDKCPDGYYRGVGVIQRNKSRNKLAKS
jgi:hypothetical protein